MTELSTYGAFELAIDQKRDACGIPWACACCGAAGILDWQNHTTIIDLMFAARHQHDGASPLCDGKPLVIETAFVFRRCR